MQLYMSCMIVYIGEDEGEGEIEGVKWFENNFGFLLNFKMYIIFDYRILHSFIKQNCETWHCGRQI